MPVDSGEFVAPTATHERRQRRRVRVSLELRIRPADFNDGSFEEVTSTRNASRDGFYFLTPHDRYYMGMRLRIRPASASPTDVWEKVGDVVRVHRQGSGLGVAVVFSEGSTASTGLVEAGQPSLNGRRGARRQPFIATTEVIDVRTGGRILARTADLSTAGCYIDTLNPLPLDSIVRLQIHKEKATVEFRAKVTSCHPGSGMGLVFEGITTAQRATLAQWLRNQSVGLEFDSAISPPAEATRHHSEEHPGFARLLDILTRKGVLTESEALSIFRDI